jgi:hypothetical protein
MANIVTRIGKGEPLTFQEGDDNFINLNTDKIESVQEDSTPMLGGNLDVNNFKITSNAGIVAVDGILRVDSSDFGGDFISLITTDDKADVLGIVLDSDFENNALIGLEKDSMFFQVADLPIVEISENLFEIEINTNKIFTADTAGLFLKSPDQLTQLNIQVTGDIELLPSENGRSIVNKINYSENFVDLGTTSGTIALDANNSNVYKITLDGNLTLNEFADSEAGQSVTLIVDTNGTGRTLTSSFKFAGGDSDLSDTDTTDIISIFYDGTDYYASIARGFE